MTEFGMGFPKNLADAPALGTANIMVTRIRLLRIEGLFVGKQYRQSANSSLVNPQ